MLQSLSKIGRSLAVLSLLVLSLLIAFPVQAGGATFTGILNLSDGWAGNFCQSYYENHSFSVTSTGNYTVRFATPSFQDVTGFAWVGALVSTNPSPGVYESNFAYYEGGTNSPRTVALTAGQSYYLIVLDCTSLAYGRISSVSYSVTISGPGDVNGGNAPTDIDSDGVADSSDNCPNNANTNQIDTDSDNIGDVCDPNPNDADDDTIDDSVDNCLGNPNPGQEDTDGDTIGDACDTTPSGDDDADGVDNTVDNCPTDANAGQADNDADGIGNRCDSTAHTDSDNDGIADRDDECPFYGDGGFGVAENGCPPNIVLPPDDRVNWQYGDLNVVVYRHEDGVAVYCYNGNSWLGMHINQALVDSWDTSQAQDVPVLEVDHAGCRTAFYILDSGEYQINIWTFEGKRYELVADNLHFDNATMRYFDPNE